MIMTGITLEIAQENLQLWIEAQKAISTGQSYRIGTRQLARANLTEVLNAIKYWNDMVNQLSRAGRSRMMRAVPRDL